VTLSRTFFCVVSPRKRKRKEKKRNINNDLAVLPSHDMVDKIALCHMTENNNLIIIISFIFYIITKFHS